MDLDRSFGFLVHDVARLFGRRFNQRALLFLGLTRAQCKVLGYLARNEGTTPVTLYATYLGVPHGGNPNVPAQGPADCPR